MRGQVEVEQEVVLHILQQFEAVAIPLKNINIPSTKINGMESYKAIKAQKVPAIVETL